jgi:hypothetical protein
MLEGFLDSSEALSSAIGRPRTALWLGGTAGASTAEERGARVAHDDGAAAEPFDLVFVTSSMGRGELGPVLARSVPRLSDGGHLVVQHGAGANADGIVEMLRGAGLEPLWRHRPLQRGPWSLTVARRPPARRTLSLTVGMISMNEAGAVGGVIDSIKEHVPEAEILLVDSSKDETPVIAESKGARVIRQVPPRGYGPAMTRLLYSATTDVIVTVDCDGTYPADRIRHLHSLVEGGVDLVNASRTHARPKAMPLANYVANRAFAAAAGVVHRFWTTDLHSGMRAYRTSMLRGNYMAEKGAALPVELLLTPTRHGYRVEDVNIDYFERIGTTTLHRWDSTKWTFKRIANAAKSGGARLS